jgi:predicted HicB family RNase H-like nuclease
MTLTIPPEIEAKASQQAFLAGVSIEDWLQHAVERELERYVSPPRSLQDEVSPEE